MEKKSLFQRIRQSLKLDDEMDEAQIRKAAGLIRNIFRYMDKDAKDIMTHRKNIVAIDATETLENAFQFMLGESYSRFPIYEEDIDQIIGFIHLREAATCYLDESLRKRPVKELDTYIRSVSFIPETKSIDKLFKEMQTKKNHIVIVLDEYGQTSGLVTLEDILEEIVGNIMDEHDVEEELIIVLSASSYIASGMLELEKLGDLLHVTFDTEEYGTLNGFMIDKLERIPNEGEECIVVYKNYRFTVLEVNDNTIQRVKIEKLPMA